MTLGEAADLVSGDQPNGQESRICKDFPWFIMYFANSNINTTAFESAAEHASQHSGTGRSTGRESFSSALSTQLSAALSEPMFDLAQHIDTFSEEERGRSTDRGPRYANPLARAESRAARAEAVIELNPAPIGKRISRSSTFFEDPTHTSAILDDNLLEPCPHSLPCANVSEVLNDLLERLNTALSTKIEHDRTPIKSNDDISTAHTEVSPPLSSSSKTAGKLATQLPTEILQQIYYNLLPVDFNSARRTCRSWFINSLEHSLLTEILQRGGFANSSYDGTAASPNSSYTHSLVNEEWMMSKRLALECALGPDWKGNGITESSSGTPSAFTKTAIVDFTEVSVQNNSTRSAGTIFTVSSCSKFLMAANGCLVYVYELNKNMCNTFESGCLRPITSIIW